MQVGTAAHVIVIGGEQLPAPLLAKWKRELLPQASFVNEYGPTEAVVGCTIWTLSDEAGLAALEDKAAAPIGLPIGNTQVYVLDSHLQPAPEGVTGEIYIGGAGVARGYVNLPELTEERFVADPFSDNRRLYKTGDVGRWTTTGELEYLGRNDSQVKLRGYRIELGEIEQQLASIEGVKAAVVVAREDQPGQKRLVAYITTDEPELLPTLRTALQSRLPEYMVPSAFVLLDELPLTPNGKVDRKALPAPEAEAQTTQYVAPRNAIERSISDVWQEVLRRERVGIDDNFFSLGGDSILSIRVVAMLRDRGVSIEVKDIFQHQTVAQLAWHAHDTFADNAPQLEPFALLTDEERNALGDDYEDAYPMSALQAGMVFHTQLENFSGVYHDMVAEQSAGRGTRTPSRRRSPSASSNIPSCARASCSAWSDRCKSSTGPSSCRWRSRTCAASLSLNRTITSPAGSSDTSGTSSTGSAVRSSTSTSSCEQTRASSSSSAFTTPFSTAGAARCSPPSSTTVTSDCSRAGSWTRQRPTGPIATSSRRSSACWPIPRRRNTSRGCSRTLRRSNCRG